MAAILVQFLKWIHKERSGNIPLGPFLMDLGRPTIPNVRVLIKILHFYILPWI